MGGPVLVVDCRNAGVEVVLVARVGSGWLLRAGLRRAPAAVAQP